MNVESPDRLHRPNRKLLFGLFLVLIQLKHDRAPSSKRQFTYDPDTYLNVNAPLKKSKKSDKEPSLSVQVLMAQLIVIWLQLKTARMQKERARRTDE